MVSIARHRTPGGFGVKTKRFATTRTKNARSRTGRTRSHVPRSGWNAPSAKKVSASLPPLAYERGPFSLEVKEYAWRFWGIRGDESDTVLVTEIQTATWDDSSAVLTGSLTFRFPEWADKLGLKEGHEIRCEVSDDDGRNFSPLWTMRIDAPNSDLVTRTRTANLVSDLNRLAQSDDTFMYVKSKAKPRGWRVDEVIRDILETYGFDVGYLPVMQTYITNWHLTDQKPLDVMYSALVREKNMTGRKYAVTMDWNKVVNVTAFQRPAQMYVVGPQLLAATGSATHGPRFATAVTMRSDPVVDLTYDKKGHRKVAHSKIAEDVPSVAGQDLYGYIHRNVYAPDVNSDADARREGKLFLALVAKVKRQFTVTLPGMPRIRRFDAFRVVLPTEGINQIVYVADARHNVDASSGYTVEAVLDFDDPFIEDRSAAILAKLTDTAVTRNRKALPTKPTKKKPPKGANARKRVAKPKGFGVTTKATKPKVTRK